MSVDTIKIKEDIASLISNYEKVVSDRDLGIELIGDLQETISEFEQIQEELRKEFFVIQEALVKNEIVAVVFDRIINPLTKAFNELAVKYETLSNNTGEYSDYATITSNEQRSRIISLEDENERLYTEIDELENKIYSLSDQLADLQRVIDAKDIELAKSSPSSLECSYQNDEDWSFSSKCW